jgi:hypothetical protein
LCRSCVVLVVGHRRICDGEFGGDSPYSVGLDCPCVDWRPECRPDRSSLGSLLPGDRGFGIQWYLRALLGQPSRFWRRCAGLSGHVTCWHGPRSLSSGRVGMLACCRRATRASPLNERGLRVVATLQPSLVPFRSRVHAEAKAVGLHRSRFSHAQICRAISAFRCAGKPLRPVPCGRQTRPFPLRR